MYHGAQHQYRELQWVTDMYEVKKIVGDKFFTDEKTGELTTGLLKLLFSGEHSAVQGNYNSLIAACLTAIGNDKETFAGRILKTNYLLKLGDSKKYRSETIGLRWKRLFNNPAGRKGGAL